MKNNFFKKIADTGFNILCQDFFFVTRDFYCLSKYINGVKICQSVCVSLKQEKFAKKQSKFSWIDFTSSFKILKKFLLNISIKLVQCFEIVGLANTHIQLVNLA